MRKILFAFLAILTLTTSLQVSAMAPVSDPQPLYGASLFKKMSVKQFEAISGKKMTFFQKVKFKVAKLVLAAPFEGDKSQTTAALLAFFLGGLGIHRFYLGYTWQGIVQILTLGGLGIWALIDFIRICTGSLEPKDGSYN